MMNLLTAAFIALLALPSVYRSPAVYHSPDGWEARLGTLDRTGISLWLEKVKDNPAAHCYGGGEDFEIIDKYPQGVWLTCNVRLEGRTFEVWKDTHAVLNLKNGRRLESVQIIASPDPCGRQVLDNTVRPFLVTERLHGYDGTVRLYIRLPGPLDPDDLESWEWE